MGFGGYKYLISMNKKHKINGTTDLLVYLAEGRNLKLESLGNINQRNPKISKEFMRKKKYIPVPRFGEKILIISLKMFCAVGVKYYMNMISTLRSEDIYSLRKQTSRFYFDRP